MPARNICMGVELQSINVVDFSDAWFPNFIGFERRKKESEQRSTTLKEKTRVFLSRAYLPKEWCQVQVVSSTTETNCSPKFPFVTVQSCWAFGLVKSKFYFNNSTKFEKNVLLRRRNSFLQIDLLAIQQKSLDRALSLYIFVHEIRSSGVRVSIAIVQIRKFYKM